MASEKPRKPSGKRTASDSSFRKPGFGKSDGPRSSGSGEGKKPFRADGDKPSKPARPAAGPRTPGKPGDRSGRKPTSPPRDRGYVRPGADFNEYSEDSYRRLETGSTDSDRSSSRDSKDRFSKRPSAFGGKREGGSDRRPSRPKPADDFSTAPRRPTGYKSRTEKPTEGKKTYGRKSDSDSEAPKRSSRYGSDEGGDRSGFRGRSDRSSDRTAGGRSSERSDRGERSSFSDRKSSDRPERTERSDRSFSDRKTGSYKGASDRGERDDKPARFDKSDRFDKADRPERAERKPFVPRTDDADSDRPVKPYEAREAAPKRSAEKPERKKASYGVSSERPAPKSKVRAEGDSPIFEKPKSDKFAKTGTKAGKFEKGKKKIVERDEPPTYNLRRFEQGKTGEEKIRLNRYIANSGVCSRREADELIAAGEIKVNGVVVTEMGHLVSQEDSVQYGKKILNREKMVYVLLNKPKGYITTTEDPEERKTVMDLVASATKERIYPVGRLDRNTTGLLLFTNDGELAQKLSHPSKETSKVYQVELDKALTEEDFDAIKAGLELEDGKADIDDLAILAPDRMALGIELHIGRNRIVRRIFEHLGYEVIKLDRVAYAGLTKKDLPRGQWRFLDEKEVIRLKYFD